MVVERLLEVAAVTVKLPQCLSLEQPAEPGQIGAELGQARPTRGGQGQTTQFAQQMVIRRRTKGAVPPGEPNVRWQNVRAQRSQALGQVARFAILKCCQQRVDPREGNQAHAALKRTRPVPASVRRVVGDPVFKPVETALTAPKAAEQPASLRHAHRPIPATRFPDRLDRRAVSQLAVV